MIEKAKFTYSPLGKAFRKQIKKFEKQGRKQIKALKLSKSNVQQLIIKDVIPEDQLNEEAKKEIKRIKEIGKMVNRED